MVDLLQGLKFLDDWCFLKGILIKCKDVPEFHEGVPFKDVFKTFKEINQLDLVRQAGVRQQYVDQAVSFKFSIP